MFNIFKLQVSLQIIILLIILALGVGAAGLYTVNQLKIFEHDAYAINSLGVIRGSMQRITKTELNHGLSDELIEKINSRLRFVKRIYITQLPSSVENNKSEEMLLKFKQLEQAWVSLKDIILKHRDNDKYHSQVFDASEQCWDKANQVVYLAQIISESKQKYYKKLISTIVTVIGVFILGIIVLVYRIVHKSLELDVITDPLTKLYNRKYFNRILHDQTVLNSRYESEFSLILFDIDFFKSINDEFGHPTGDSVLVKLASIFKNHIRESDYIFRIGGEEFAIIVPQTDLKQSEHLAEKYRAIVDETDFEIGRSVTASFGVSQFDADEGVEGLIKRADKALYLAKSSGRNKVVLSSDIHSEI